MEKDVEEMAKDDKLVEATRAAFKEKNLKRINERKRTLKKIGHALLFTIAASATFSAVDYYANQKLAEKMAQEIRSQELNEILQIDFGTSVDGIDVVKWQREIRKDRKIF